MKRHSRPVHRQLPYRTDCEPPPRSVHEHVYETCDRATTEPLPWGGPRQTVTAENDGLSVSRSLVFQNDEVAFEYVVSSERSRRVRFRLVDRYPGEGVAERTATDRDEPYTVVDATWWLDADSELEFRRRVPDAYRDVVLPTENVADTSPQISALGPRDGNRPTAGHAIEESTSHGASVLVALPAYNEAASISRVVANAKRHADAVLVVDDGSDDGTAARAWEAGAFVTEHDTNRGYGATLKTIFAAGVDVGVDHLVILDSDGQHEPADIPRLVAEQRASDADLVIGNRFGEGADTSLPRYRRFGLGVINVLTNIAIGRRLTGSTIQDTQSGFRAYSSRALRSLLTDDELGERMEISTDILYHAEQHGYAVTEVGTTIFYEVEGASSHNPVFHGYLLVRNLLPMISRERPLFVLWTLSLLFTVVGIGAPAVMLGGLQLGVGALTSWAVLLTGSLLCATGATLYTLGRGNGI